jgi:hypothetical protein
MKFVSCLAALAAGALLAACVAAPVAKAPAPAALTTATPEAMVAAIRAAATRDTAELSVQPLRDAEIEDLRQQAQAAESAHRYALAAAALDQALVLVPDDPALLQERAEAALLLRDPVAAETLARKAYAIGAKVGPLCRRHWATIEQTRLLAGDAAGAASARVQAADCKVTGPNRF